MQHLKIDNEIDYISVNRALWNEKTKYHSGAAFYKMDAFFNGTSSLNEAERDLLGDVRGKTVLHLQCHFGQDSLSLARMGARVTGVDFSGEAISKAKELNDRMGLDATFICTDVYSLPELLVGQFDIVFTSYGVLGWLPDMKKWAEVVARFLNPGGIFVLAEFHPVLWMFNADFSHVVYSYFNREMIVETTNGTYADRSADLKMTEIGWNHDLAEVLQNLIAAGLTIDTFQEFDSSPYCCFQPMVEVQPGKYQITGMEGKLPLVYALRAVKHT